MTPYHRDAMPLYTPAPAPRVFRRKDGQPSAFHYGGEPFVCRLNGVPFTRRMLLNRAAIGLPLPPEAWALIAKGRAA